MTMKESKALLQTLSARFAKQMHRHPTLEWADVQSRLEKTPSALRALQEMEATGGEPDVVGEDGRGYWFCDCAAESPSGRRSLCFDREAREARKENRPVGSAHEMAEAMGVSLLTEDEYRRLQTLGEFDLKTSSWIATPADVRRLGGALFGDRRFGRVFVYHNGAQSYYAARGFRGSLYV
jgi:hypothetical protein